MLFCFSSTSVHECNELLSQMQVHVQGKRHQKAQNDRKCVEGITIKSHHMSWDDWEAEADAVSKDENPDTSSQKPSAQSPPRSTKQEVSNQGKSWSPEDSGIVEGSKAIPARPKPSGRKAEKATDRNVRFSTNGEEAARKFMSLPEATEGQMSPPTQQSLPFRSSVKVPKDGQTEQPIGPNLRLHNTGKLRAKKQRHISKYKFDLYSICKLHLSLVINSFPTPQHGKTR